ncbi:MAG: Kelch repeat-containing protein, partial [Stellaceae bacterium]
MKRVEMLVAGLALWLSATAAPAAAQPLPQWKMAAPLPQAIGEIVAATVGGKIYVISGLDNRPGVHAPAGDNWVYDPANDSWRQLAPMPTPRGAGEAVEVGGKIYVIGGARSSKPGDPGAPILLGSTDQLVVGTVEAYDPATDKWQERAPMPTARNHFFAGAVNGKIYA